MPGRSIRPTQSSHQKTTKKLPREVRAEEMLRITSTGAASTTSATSFESDPLPTPTGPIVACMGPSGVDRITQSLNAGVELPSTAAPRHDWRFPYLLGIFNSCCHRWLSRRD